MLAWLAATAALLVAVTVPLTSFDLYREYSAQAFELAGGGDTSTAPPNQSLAAMTGRWFDPAIARPIGLGLAAVVLGLTILAVVMASRSKRDDLLSMSIIIAGTALVAPLSWVHHQVLLTIPLVAVLRATRGTRRAAFGWAVILIVIGALGAVGLAWKQLQVSSILVSIGTYSMILLWVTLLAWSWLNPSPTAARVTPGIS